MAAVPKFTVNLHRGCSSVVTQTIILLGKTSFLVLMHMKSPLAVRDHLRESLFCDIFAIRYVGVYDLMRAICSRVNISFCESVGWEWIYKQLNTGTILLRFQKSAGAWSTFGNLIGFAEPERDFHPAP